MSFCKYAFFDLSDIRFCLLSFNQEVCSRPCPYCDHYCPMGLCSPSLDASRYQCSTTSGSHLTCCFQGFCSAALARYSGDTAICWSLELPKCCRRRPRCRVDCLHHSSPVSLSASPEQPPVPDESEAMLKLFLQLFPRSAANAC